MLLKFDEEKHKYYLETDDGSELPETLKKPFVSVSKFLDYFTDPFDEVEQAEKFITSKNNKLGLKTKEEVLAYWELRRNHGTALHAKREKAAIEKGAFTYRKDEKGHKICYNLEELKNLPIGIHTELTIPLMSAWLIGTSDYVEVYEKDGKRMVNLGDFKTNGHKLKAEPEKFYSKGSGTKQYKYFYAPISHRPCDTFQKYTYQLSTYAYFLEKLGYEVGKLEIEAIEMDDNGNEKKSWIMPVEYRRDDVRMMIDYYNKTKK